MTAPRFDFEPLQAYAARRYRSREGIMPPGNGSLSTVIGVSRSRVTRWAAQGTLSMVNAEEAADGLGVDPSAIWPDYWKRVLAYYDKEESRGSNASAASTR